MFNSLLKRYKNFIYNFIDFFSHQFSFSRLFQRTVLGLFILAFGVVFRLISAFKSVNRRTLSALGTTLMLSALLSACAGGGGGGSDAPAPTAPTFSVSSSNISIDEDFATSQLVASVSNATSITVSQSNTGVVTVTTSNAQVNVSSIANANGRTTLTISAANGTLIVTTQVTVIVNAVNDPPVLSVSTTALTLLEDFATTEVITVTRSDVDSNTLTLTVAESSTGVVTVTTSVSGVQVASILSANGRTTLTIRVTDGDGLFDTTDVLVVVNDVDAPPVLTVSTNLILVDEDFTSPVVIRTTATDADGDALIVSISSSSHLVDAVLSTPVNGMSIITNMITLTAMTDLNGTTTLTVQAIDAGGTATTEQIVVVVNAVDDPIPFTLSTTAVSLSVHGSQLDRIINAISISNSDNKTLRAQIGVTTSGGNIFSANPTPVVSFTTNALTALTTLTSSTPTAQLYFTIAPNQTGTATLTVHLINLDDSSTSQQTMVVSVNSPNISPVIVAANSSITNLVVHGGHLYANDAMASGIGVSRFLATASVLGGHLMNINSVEEFSFMRSTASGLIFQEAWLGLILPNRLFPGELSWITHDSTIGYGYAIRNGAANLTVYPGHFNLTWFPDFDLGLRANRYGRSTTVANWTIYATGNGGVFFLIDDGGDGFRSDGRSVADRNVIYEFPQGLLTTSTNPTSIVVVTSTTVRLTGFDLNGDTISTNDWSITDLNGGSAIFNNDSQSSGVQTVTMIYTAPANFVGQTTVVVTLQVDGLSTTHAISLIVDEPPTIALSTRNITLAEDFGTFDIGITVTDRLVSTSLPFSVSASTSGILTITTSANNIQLSAASNANGTTTITVQAMDARGQSSFANVVVVVAPVNDPPVLSVSTTALTLTEDFATTEVITVTSSDVDSNTLALTVSESTTGVVSLSTSSTGVQVVSIADANGQTTLTITVGDGTASVSTQILVTVNAVNDTPTISLSTSVITLFEDFLTVIPINVTNTDIDNNTLTMTVVESSTSVVRVTTSVAGVQLAPINHANGQMTLTIMVSDGDKIASTQILVTVIAVNDTPTLSVSTNLISTSAGFSTITINTTATDIEDSTLSFSVLASAMQFTVTTSVNAIILNSIPNASGQVTLTVSASDSSGVTVSQTIIVNLSTDSTPIVTVSTNRITVLEDFSTPVVFTATAMDPDGESIGIVVVQFTPLVDVEQTTLTNNMSTITITSRPHLNGITTMQIATSDIGGRAAVAEFVLEVIPVNDPLVLSVPLPTLNLREDFSHASTIVTVTNLDNDTLTVSVAESTTGVVRVTTSNSGVRISNIANGNGRTTLSITINDGDMDSTAQVVVIVTAVDDPPMLSVSTTSLILAEDFATVLIGTTRTDVDGDTLTVSLTVSTPGIITATTQPTGIQLVPFANASGQTILTINLTDGTTNISTQVSVTVMSVNDTPTLTLSTDNLVVVEDFTDPILIATATDVESATLTFSVVESATGVVSVTTSETGVRIAPIMNANGDTTLTISVSDGSKRSTAQVVVTVVAVNDTPTISVSTSTLTLIEDFSTTSITVNSGDIDSNTLTLTVVESATGVVSVTTSSAGVQVVAIANANGQTTLTIMVSDSNKSASTEVVVTVIADNDPPTLTITTANLVLAEDFMGASTVATADDVDGDTLTWTVANSNNSVVSVTTSAAGVQVVAIANANGQTTLTITVTDGTTLTSAQVSVTVTAVNDPPTLIVSTNSISTFVGFSTITINTTASDIEDSTLSFSVLAFPTGVVRVSTSANAIVLSAISGISGQTTITVTTIDSSSSVVTQLIAVNVINRAPVLEVSMNRVNLQEDFSDSLVIRTTATDVDGDIITLSLSSSTHLVNADMSALSNGMSTITLTAVDNANGTTTLTVQAMAAGQSVSTEIVVFVAPVNDTPTLSVSTNSLLTVGGFAQITIHTTASDVEQGTLSFAVQQSSTGVVNVSTSANAIILRAIANASGQTTLTVRTTDSAGLTAIQVITVNVTLMQSDAPVLSVSTNLITVQEDFTTSVVIRTTATDAGTVTLSIRSSSQLVNAVLSSPVNGLSVITNTITLSSIADLNGTTTLTVQATDSGGVSTTEQVVVVVNAIFDPIEITLSTSAITLSVNGSQLDRNVQSINISNVDNQPQRVQLQVTSGGGPIFSANPSPVASFTTNVLTTVTTLTSAASTAQLYFTVAPNSTGTATLLVQLTDLDNSITTQQTMVVSVISPDVPPTIVPTISSITNLVVHGGRLYANALLELTVPLILEQARSLGGHLININSVEELDFVRGATSNLITQHAWFGLALPQPDFPGELSWITNNSTIAYGFVSTTTRATGSITVYPGHFNLNWNAGAGLIANRNGSANAFNWTVYANSGGSFLLGDRGDGNPARRGLYEFPQGITPTSINPISLNSGTTANLSLTGFDLNGDAINTSDWSITDPNGGSATFNHVFLDSGVQRVNMIYTAPANFGGQTTVVVSLGVNGLSTTYAISFIVDGPPTIALSTNAITLAEEFSNFVIGTTVTDQGVSGSLPFSVQTTSTGLVSLTTTINSIQFSGALNFNGRVTLTVQATDSAAQTVSTRVVVTVEGVNDTPTISVSTNNISILGGFSPITIDTTATDVEQGALPFTAQASPQGVVSINTRTNAIVLSPIVGTSGRTTLTVSAIDSNNATGVQIIAVNVIVRQSTTPVLSVSTNLIGLQEDFGSVVIGTTATDVESGTLVVTVSSSTHLVNTVISTHGLTLSSVANLFGTTTLTVRARDTDGVFVSTELVVIVASVNDTPTLTVSSNTVNLGLAPVVLNVTASDVEDTSLTFSVSSGQRVVNTVITNTRLILTRLNQSGQILLTLTSTDTEGGTVSTVVTVTIPSFFDVTTGIKTLDFAWSAVSTATYYQLQSNPDGNSGFTDLSTTGIVVSPNSTDIKQTTAQGLVSLHRYIPRVSEPEFVVNGCNSASCGASIGNMVTLTNAQLNGMIGRLQASNPDSEDQFGWSVDLSGDGNTLAVGAYREGGSSSGINGAQNNDSTNPGAVYLFRRMGGAWSQQAYIKALIPGSNDQFGWSVSLNDDGNALVVGAPSEDGPSTGVNKAQTVGANNTGAVYAFRFSGSVWSQQAYIKASNTGDGDLFGYAVALSGDGNTLAVGARNEASSSTGVNRTQNDNATFSGATYLFRIDSGMWSQQAFIKASNSTGGIQFGHSVSLNIDGDTLAVGALSEQNSSTGVNGAQNNHSFGSFRSGSAYLFRFNHTSSMWSQQAYFKASNAAFLGQFGHSVDLSDDGNTLAVGANGEGSDSTGVNGMQNNGAGASGAVYVFRFSIAASTWSQQAFIKASNTGANDGFGDSVSLSGDGNALVVGASGEDGTANGVEGTNHASTISSASGAAYVFEFSNDTWAQQAFIKATDTSANANFAHSVSISSDGGTIAVGAWGVNTNTGAIYLY